MDINDNNQNPPIPPNSQKWAYWEKGGQHAQMLFHMLYNGTIKSGWKPHHIVAEFPQHGVYKPESSRSTVSRYRHCIAHMKANGQRLLQVPGLELDEGIDEVLSSGIGT
jgi:hypothetical protein